MQAQASGTQQAQPDLKLQSRPTAIPAISKSTELQPQGQPSFVFGQSFPPFRTTPKMTPRDDTVISTEAAHAFVSPAVEKSASRPRCLPADASPSSFFLASLGVIPEWCLPMPMPMPVPCLSSRQGSAVAVAFKLSSRMANPKAAQAPDPNPAPPSVTIHHLPLDANPFTFYSLRIFHTLAPLANPIAVTKRTLRAATNPRPHLIQSPESFCSAVNPVPPDGGQHSY
jgi:hypothetical protein